jgi:RNA polymerase sigma-54 factor
MAIELKTSLKLTQAPIMTPQLQQAIKLLQLNHLELADVVAQEMVENPMLEENHEKPENNELADKLENAESKVAEGEANSLQDDKITDAKDDFDWDAYIEHFNSSSSSPPSVKVSNDEIPNYEQIISKELSLEDHLRWQIGFQELADNEKKFIELIIGNLDDNGYLLANIENLAREAGLVLEDAEEVLKLVQHLDPLGVASRDLQECLLIQAKMLPARDPVLEDMLENHWTDFQKKNFQKISRAVKMPLDEVLESARQTLGFEPKPGRQYGDGGVRYITPDIFIHKVGDEYEIVLNEDGLPKLKLSNSYRNVLAQGKKDGGETKEYIQEKLRSAVWLIRSIHNRQKTIYKVAESIIRHQRDFFENGVSHLKPMILRDVANDIGMHESTISRVTTNKYMHTPVGTFELKYFFNSGISGRNGAQDLASESVKERIKILVDNEDSRKPLSDQKLVELLRDENIDIARRTVAKYREMLGILSSSKRKNML